MQKIKTFTAGFEDAPLSVERRLFLRVLRLCLVWRATPGAGVTTLALPVGVISREPGERIFTPVIDAAALLAFAGVCLAFSRLLSRLPRLFSKKRTKAVEEE